MKKNIILISISLTVGLLAGYLIFNYTSYNSGKDTSEAKDENDPTEVETQMWTCSMHPQIMQAEPGKCPICGMELVPTESGVGGLSLNKIEMTENAMALANIQTSVVGSQVNNEEHTLSLSGKIVTNEETNTVQASYFDGRIEKLHVNYEGEEVRKGQLLATLYAPSLIEAQQELLTASTLKEEQPELYKAIRGKLRLWKISNSQIDEIERTGIIRDNFPIYATVSGTVAEKLASEGDYVQQGQPILTVSNLNTVWAEFDAYEGQISEIKKGQEIEIIADAYSNQHFSAKISFIDPFLNKQTRIVKVRATLKNTNQILKPGMFISGKLESHGKSDKEEIYVPASAVLWTGKRSIVYVKSDPDRSIFEMREVTIGNKVGDTYAVIDGLGRGEVIVTNGTFTVDAAAQLQGKKSMMNNEGKFMPKHEGHSDPSSSESTQNNKKERIAVSKIFQKQLNEVFQAYIQVKNALVDDNVKNTQKAAEKTLKNLKNVDMNQLKNKKAHEEWMSIQKKIKKSSEAIANATEIEEQRDHFKELSDNMAIGIQLFGINKEVYHQYCPMKNTNGAHWLSLENEIENPYYGAAMLNCGEIIDTLD